MNRVVCGLIVSLLVGFGALETAQAQHARSQHSWTSPVRPCVAAGRFLGMGYGNGYHWRNPGPDSDYYNPYSERNTVRNTASHEYQGGFRPYASPTGNHQSFESTAPERPFLTPAQPVPGQTAPQFPENNPERSPVPADRLDPFGNERGGQEPGVSATPDWKIFL